jgi:hypothetical protein
VKDRKKKFCSHFIESWFANILQPWRGRFDKLSDCV